MDDRYQFQNRFIKVCRWLRWKPWYALKSLWAMFMWNWNGARIPDFERRWFRTKWSYPKHIWTLSMSLADIKMKHMWTLEEVINDVRSK